MLIMKKRITIIATAVLPLVYLLSACNSKKSSDNGSIPADSATIAKGKGAFSDKCTGCHNFIEDGIGPQLAGVTSQQSVEWIKNFIKNPKQVIDSGDTTAQKLIKEYKIIMPSFGYLPDEEINAVIAFIHIQKKRERKPVAIDSSYIKNPIPDTIKSSDLLVSLDFITQIP